MPLRDVAIALLAVSILGSNFVAIKLALAEVPPLLLTALRFFFAAVPAVFLIRPPAVRARFVVGFGLALGVAQFGLLFTAIHLGMPAGLSSLVIQAQVFFTVAIAFFTQGERPLGMQVVGGLLAASGIVTIGAGQARTASLLPTLLVLGAAFAWACANIITKRAGRINMLAYVVWGSLVAPWPLLVLSYLLEGSAADVDAMTHLSWTAIGSVAFLAYPTTLLGFALWTGLLSRHPTATITPFGFLVPVIGLGSTHVLLGEPFGVVELAGSVLVMSGLLVNLQGSRSVPHVAALAASPTKP